MNSLNQLIAIVATLATSLGSLIGAFVLWRKSRPEVRKLQAESNKIMVDQFSAEVELIRENYDRMLKTQLESIVKPMERKPKLPPELRAYFELKKGVKNDKN